MVINKVYLYKPYAFIHCRTLCKFNLYLVSILSSLKRQRVLKNILILFYFYGSTKVFQTQDDENAPKDHIRLNIMHALVLDAIVSGVR